MTRARRRRLLTIGSIVAVAFGVAGIVGAYWSAGSNPGGNGHALAGALPTAATPSVSLAGRTATISWAQSVVNGSPLGQLTSGGYSVTRYAETDPGTPIAPGGTCAGVLSGASDPLSCTESGLATGRWTYAVTPRLYSWTGGESTPSPTAIIAPDRPASVTLTNGGGAGGAFINTANQSSLSFAVVLLATSLASDTVTLTLTDGSQTVTQSAAGMNGGGTLTFAGVDASTLANGTITISASAASSYGDTSAPRTITRTKDTNGPALVSLSMRDNNVNGKVDRVLATFSESLAAYSAGTAPWTLASVPSGGSLSSVSVAAAVATLTIAEGAGAPDTAVGSFTVALSTSATGIRDAAGNLSSFAATSPADGARPVLVSGTLVMRDIDGNGKVDRVLATFSETLEPSTDTAPWTLTAVPSAGSLSSVSTSGATATLVLAEGAGAQNTAVGSFRVVLAASATGIRDAAANQASFGSTAPVDQATPVLVSLVMQDVNVNGKVDRVLATFSESLAAYSAGTAPWTLASVPSGGSLSSVSVAAAVATLTIAEGAGAPDTAVGSFTVALSTSATGIRDAAGNLSSFAATSPADGARPVLVSGTLVMRDIDGNGKVDRVLATFSETLEPSTDTAPWTLTAVPSAGSLSSVSTSGATATLVLAEGAGAQNTAVGSFRVVLAASATGIRDAAANQASFGSTAPVDQATPVLVSLVMQDVNVNGKVDRVLATFSESLAAYSAGTAPWTLASVPSGGSLSSVSVAAAVATLTIAEGAGAPDTAVGSFTVALSTSATGIRDAAGNLSSFAATSPADGARPVLVSGTLVMRDIDGNGKVDRVLATFSETLEPSTDTAPWTLTAVPSAGSLSSVSTSGATATLVLAEGAGAQNTAVGSFRVVLAASATGIRDAAANQASFGSTAPVDQATPVLVSLVMQDVNVNGKVDRVLATFSESLAAYSAGTAPWTLASVPSGGSLSSVSVAAAVATLTIAEGAGAPDTAVGSFTVALSTSATGIRDAAGNLSSFAATSPADGARPVPIAVGSTNNGVTAGLMEAGDILQVTFSEQLAALGSAVTTITESDPTGSGSDRLTVTGLTAVAGVSTGSNLYITTDNTSASFASSAIGLAGAVVSATVSGGCTGTCGVNIGVGIGALVFTPDPTLRDGAGNTAAGSFTTAATFRLF